MVGSTFAAGGVAATAFGLAAFVTCCRKLFNCRREAPERGDEATAARALPPRCFVVTGEAASKAARSEDAPAASATGGQ